MRFCDHVYGKCCQQFSIYVPIMMYLAVFFRLGMKGDQGCALRKITRSPKVPNYEIQGAQHKAYMKEIRLSGRPKAKINRLRHPGTLRAQPWGWIVKHQGNLKSDYQIFFSVYF